MTNNSVAYTREQLEEAIIQGEASMKLEGFSPATDPVYLSLRSDILAGKISFEEAIETAVRSVDRSAALSAA